MYLIVRHIHKIVKSNCLLCHVCPSIHMSSWSNLAPTGRIFMKFYVWVFFNHTRITGSVREHQYTFMIISRSVLLGMRNLWDKSYGENQNTHFIFNNFFFKLCHLWEKLENIGVAGRPQMVICHMCISCWVPKDTDTHLLCNTVFPLEQCLLKRASLLHYI
jgi:hypothetical protein